MVTLSFQYGTGKQVPFEASTRYLVLDIGPQCLAVLLCQSQTGQVDAAELYSGLSSPEADWEEMTKKSSLLGYKHLETRVVFHFSRAMAIPTAFFQPQRQKRSLTCCMESSWHRHPTAIFTAIRV